MGIFGGYFYSLELIQEYSQYFTFESSLSFPFHTFVSHVWNIQVYIVIDQY